MKGESLLSTLNPAKNYEGTDFWTQGVIRILPS